MMTDTKQIDAVTKAVLEKITPKKAERTKVETLSRDLMRKIKGACKDAGVQAKVRIEGSVAKDTWLSGTPDIDVFMRLPTSIPRKNLGEIGLKIAKQAAGDAEQIERFAEHPYLQIFLEGYRADIVPAYDADPGEWQSATDRTPYHTDYIKANLSQKLLGEVRLLKKLMQGVGVYGAEIKVGGFSGYLCELLIMKYGSFATVVEAFAAYNKRVVIDLKGFYVERQNELALLFPEPLVIVDPVDKGRNVASAVQPQKLYAFIAASRAFLKNPNEEFFFPPEPAALALDLVAKRISERRSALLFLAVGDISAVPDVLWGQLYRSKRSLRKMLEINDFPVLNDDVWSNEDSLSIFVFELETQALPNVKKHLGPPLEREAECRNFLEKYSQAKTALAGPYLEDGRWVVTVTRKYADAVALVRARLADGGKNAGMADLIAAAIKKELKVLVGAEVLKVYVENSDFAVFLTDFLEGKPFWLRSA